MSPDDITVQERASDVVRAVVAAARCGDLAFDICGAAMLVADVDQQTRSLILFNSLKCLNFP